jgi:hypothetical protein
MVPLRARRSWTRYVGALAPQASDYRNARATYDINLLSYHVDFTTFVIQLPSVSFIDQDASFIINLYIKSHHPLIPTSSITTAKMVWHVLSIAMIITRQSCLQLLEHRH